MGLLECMVKRPKQPQIGGLGRLSKGAQRPVQDLLRNVSKNNSKSKVFLRNRKAGAPLGCLGKQSLALYAGASKLKDRCLVGNEK